MSPAAAGSSRADGRAPDELRPVTIELGAQAYAEGSALISCGDTRVLCAATVEAEVPRWMRGKGRGWVTAEYAMLPRATHERTPRESVRGRIGGRTHEIQRLIGRSLRSVTDLETLGERVVQLDCDVLQADGGTRTASICGAYVALHDACTRLVGQGRLLSHPIGSACAAVSVGVVDGIPLLDLEYTEDVRAEVDMNVVMTSEGSFVEVQGTAEGQAFSKGELDEMLSLAEHGIAQLLEAQEAALREPPPRRES